MQRHYYKTQIYHLLVYFSVFCMMLITLQGCMALLTPRPQAIVERDIVKSTTRVKTKLYAGAQERYSPLYSSQKTIIKEWNDSNETTYTVYDLLSMNIHSHALENKVYLIVDGKVIPIDIEQQEIENTTEISEESDTILTADSTKVSVVTGYTQYTRKNFSLIYTLSLASVEVINNAEEVSFRYYSGPNMITTNIQGSNLQALKKVITTEQ